MPKTSDPGLTLFLDILHKLEAHDIPYMIIGGFAATIYGITRATFDIDIVVDLSEEHIQALADAYPPPRFYADPHQMQQATEKGASFNIIDSTRGEKADLFPLSMDRRYESAFERRVRQVVDIADAKPFSVWAARPEEVIIGKLLAWNEGRSGRHPSDVYEMMVFHYLGGPSGVDFSESYIDGRATEISDDAAQLWQLLKTAAREEATRHDSA